jgi:2-haloacid dehalogenase
MMPEPVIIFDFGGVLLEWDPRNLYRKLFDGDEQAMERFLTEVDFYAWNAKQDEGRPFVDGIAAACAEHPQYCELLRLYRERWAESISGPIEGTVRILHTLKKSGYRLVGLSNWSTETFPQMRGQYEFFNWLELILLSGEVGVNKPDPRIFEILMDRLGSPASSCLLIDDSVKNIVAAQRLGFQTIHFGSPEQLSLELAKKGIQTLDQKIRSYDRAYSGCQRVKKILR